MVAMVGLWCRTKEAHVADIEAHTINNVSGGRGVEEADVRPCPGMK